MNGKKKKIKLISAIVCSCLAITMLVFDFRPMNVQADDIDDLIAAGSYVEGEVIAAIMMDGDVPGDDSSSSGRLGVSQICASSAQRK